MNKSAVVAIVVVIVALVGGGILLANKNSDNNTTSSTKTSDSSMNMSKTSNSSTNSDSASSTTPTATDKVSIKDFAYSPASISVKVGTAVTWTNDDSVAHTVTTTSGPEDFDSSSVAPGATFSHTFTKAGTYKYHCTFHPSMPTATVIVTAS